MIRPLILLAALVMPAARTQELPRKILFIGDSFTYFQNGIYTHLEKLAASANPPLVLTTGKSVFPGEFLHRLWDRPEPRAAIATGAYDAVVLQEDIPETTVADF